METKELKIQIPEGYCVDESKSTFEKIVFKKKDTKPRSWEEYCKQQAEKDACGYEIVNNTSIDCAHWAYFTTNITHPGAWRNVLLSEGLCEAFLAMMQLMSLRQAWIHKWSLERGLTKDWEPDWNGVVYYDCIEIYNNKYVVDEFFKLHRPLSFPTKEMATDFMNTFKDLLETAKPLI